MVDMTRKCERCKEADIPVGVQGRRIYCDACRRLQSKENNRRFKMRERERVGLGPPRKKLQRVDWTVADPLIRAGKSPKEIAAHCGCAENTILGRKYKLGRIDRNPVLAPCQSAYFNYRERLHKWFRKLQKRIGMKGPFEEFLQWLKTPEGQALLERINWEITPDWETEQREADYTCHV